MNFRFTLPLRIVVLALALASSGMLSAHADSSSRSKLDSIPKFFMNQEEFILRGVARNGDTGENFDHIYVDVYRILADGSVEIVRADRFLNGKFEIWLQRGEHYMLMMNYNNTAFLEGLLNPSNAQIVDGVLDQIFILDEYRPDLLTDELTAEDNVLADGLLAPEDETPELPSAAIQPVSMPEDPIVLVKESDRSDPNVEASFATDRPASNSEEPVPSAAEETIASDHNQISEKTTEPDLPMPGVYQLSGSTSFRSEATHLSSPILRFASGDKVELLEKTDQFWWKVRFEGKTGWVKAAMLQQETL